MRLLSKDKILVKLKAVPEHIFEYHTDTYQEKISYVAGWDDAAKAQLKKVVEWGTEYCVWHPQQSPNGSLYANLHRRQCDVCWQDLLKEIE